MDKRAHFHGISLFDECIPLTPKFRGQLHRRNARLAEQVRVTKEHQEEQKGLIKRCQGEEAACQVLQRNLSSCHPGLTISIP